VLTLVLLLWGVAMLLMTKPKVAGSNPIQQSSTER
jgi:hypothetical protein